MTFWNRWRREERPTKQYAQIEQQDWINVQTLLLHVSNKMSIPLKTITGAPIDLKLDLSVGGVSEGA